MDVHNIVSIIDGLAGAYLRGQLSLCLIIGAASTIMLAAFGVPQALLLGTIAGMFEIIPNLGPFIGAIPAVLVTLLFDPIKALWVALGFVIIQQVENAFLVPRISGNAVRFHPAVVIVLVLVGSEVAGLWGMLLAVPLAAMVRDVCSVSLSAHDRPRGDARNGHGDAEGAEPVGGVSAASAPDVYSHTELQALPPLALRAFGSASGNGDRIPQ